MEPDSIFVFFVLSKRASGHLEPEGQRVHEDEAQLQSERGSSARVGVGGADGLGRWCAGAVVLAPP